MSSISNPLTAPAVPAAAKSGSASTSTGATNLANENTFLKLLVAQMQNQDPLNPVDSTQFVTQLAQYSSLEQLTGIKQDADSLLTAASKQTPVATPTTSTPNVKA